MSLTPDLTPASERRAPTARGERTRERILDAAEEIFAERGFAGATLRDVAAAVGVRNPSLYNILGLRPLSIVYHTSRCYNFLLEKASDERSTLHT